MISFALLLLGLFLLLAGGAGLVRGASGIAETFGVSPLIVGLTVVAFGTSSPELVVNILGALQGETDIAFGNIAGSNLANLGLVLGSAAVIAPMTIQSQIIRRELPLLLLATTILLVMTLDPYVRGFSAILDRSDGLILLLLFGIFVYIMISDFLRQQQDPLLTSVGGLSPVLKGSQMVNWLYTGGGIVGLSIGGQLSIEHGVKLAEVLGLSPAIIGMLVIAIGTSLPELVTSIIAAMRKQADLCLGNVIGSNIFNILFVLPISALIEPLRIPNGGVYDIMASLFFAAIIIPVFFMKDRLMTRSTGILFMISYFVYMYSRVLGGLGNSNAF
ncbi:MAG: calcium/sodium antiporter [Proteobacteria bacterium]|nr:calcium/sodium antiporter [Pseudomonadota bacterium]